MFISYVRKFSRKEKVRNVMKEIFGIYTKLNFWSSIKMKTRLRSEYFIFKSRETQCGV